MLQSIFLYAQNFSNVEVGDGTLYTSSSSFFFFSLVYIIVWIPNFFFFFFLEASILYGIQAKKLQNNRSKCRMCTPDI